MGFTVWEDPASKLSYWEETTKTGQRFKKRRIHGPFQDFEQAKKEAFKSEDS